MCSIESDNVRSLKAQPLAGEGCGKNTWRTPHRRDYARYQN
jgi:hypothetical protein